MMNLFDMTKKDLQDFLVAQGMKKFRADQIFHYIYKQSFFPGMTWCSFRKRIGTF